MKQFSSAALFTGEAPEVLRSHCSLRPRIAHLKLVIFLVYFFDRKYQSNAMLWDMSWLIPKDEVIKHGPQATSFSMLSMVGVLVSPRLRVSMKANRDN